MILLEKLANDDCWLSFMQLHDEAWVRFAVLSIIMIGIYAFYHAKPGSNESIIYQRAPTEATR